MPTLPLHLLLLLALLSASRATETPPPIREEPLGRQVPIRENSCNSWTNSFLDEKLSYSERLAAIHRLSNLTLAEQQALLADLNLPPDPSDPLPPVEQAALRNDIVLLLIRETADPAPLTTALINQFNDPRQDLIWRDYCLQFIGTLIPRLPEDATRAQALATLHAALEMKTTSHAATALLALHRLKSSAPLRENSCNSWTNGCSPLAQSAYNLANDPQAAELVRVTALQIATLEQHPQAIPLARQLLSDPATGASLQVSACATLATQPTDPENRKLLQHAQTHGDTRVARAATLALAKGG